MSTIIEDVKMAMGIEPDNLAFDTELLFTINAAKTILIQQGVDELDINIDESTAWPTFNSDLVGELSKEYLARKARTIFDPTSSETIANTLDKYLAMLEARIRHEIEEIADV